MKRRTFLKIFSMGSVSIAAGCTAETEKSFYALVEAPFDMVTGRDQWYASVCRECPAGCGILAKNRDGRVIKIEGNPHHPVNRGNLCMRGQASLQGLYNPDRIKTPLVKTDLGWSPVTYSHAIEILKEKTSKAVLQGYNRVYMMTEVVGETLLNLMGESLSKWRSSDLHVFEPLAYESLKAANKVVFDRNRLHAFHMDKCDFLLSFGADFLETWLSPVEYARKFKEMHKVNKDTKSLFFQVSPFQTLTGANADAWISCYPGTEAVVVLGLLQEGMKRGLGRKLPLEISDSMDRLSSSYTTEKVLQISGVAREGYEKLQKHLFKAKRPLILGTASGGSGQNSFQADVAVNLLNLLIDPELGLLDFDRNYRVSTASKRADIRAFFKRLGESRKGVLLLNNVNPVYHFSPKSSIREILQDDNLFVVSFSNFMDETTCLSDLVLPVHLPLETWDEYSGAGYFSTLQPAMGAVTESKPIGDMLIAAVSGTVSSESDPLPSNYKAYLLKDLLQNKRIQSQAGWLKTLQDGGVFERHLNAGQNHITVPKPSPGNMDPHQWHQIFENAIDGGPLETVFMATPSIRYFDGRGANRPWLSEIPDPLTCVAWQNPVQVHPETCKTFSIAQGDVIAVKSTWGEIEAPVYASDNVRPGVLLMSMGLGHESYGRYAENMGINPLKILPPGQDPASGGPLFYANAVKVRKTGQRVALAHTDGSRLQYNRKIAVSESLEDLRSDHDPADHGAHQGLGMWDFPLALPIPSAYDSRHDFYDPPPNDGYRWAMVVDLDKCIGCASCAAACYAENNLGIVGADQMVKGREMAWLSIHRYVHEDDPAKNIFMPMMCQHCDNAPCESVCPVYAPHHSKEGLNNQIYNRCIGTRFCSQNCPYKVRRFNWFDWQWPEPLNLQLNPDVTVRSKGVMEKCSFCIQRIKHAHGTARNNNRLISDGEIQPACLQACPTGVFTFGNILDKNSKVRKLAESKRAYQAMGYLNTKPAVIYLKKVVQEV